MSIAATPVYLGISDDVSLHPGVRYTNTVARASSSGYLDLGHIHVIGPKSRYETLICLPVLSSGALVITGLADDSDHKLGQLIP